MSNIMQRLEQAVSRHHPDISCELREHYYSWTQRVQRPAHHWHEEIQNINGFLNWLLLDQFDELPRRRQTQLRCQVNRARRALNALDQPNDVPHWIDNLLERYFTTYAEVVA